MDPSIHVSHVFQSHLNTMWLLMYCLHVLRPAIFSIRDFNRDHHKKTIIKQIHQNHHRKKTYNIYAFLAKVGFFFLNKTLPLPRYTALSLNRAAGLTSATANRWRFL